METCWDFVQCLLLISLWYSNPKDWWKIKYVKIQKFTQNSIKNLHMPSFIKSFVKTTPQISVTLLQKIERFSFCFSFKWGEVFKNGPSKTCRRQPLKNLKWCGLCFSRPYQFKCLSSTNFTWSIFEYFGSNVHFFPEYKSSSYSFYIWKKQYKKSHKFINFFCGLTQSHTFTLP